jgi:Uma2 family endonuclease
MDAVQPDAMSEADYLALEDGSSLKHEYSRGRVYAMTGGSVRHGIITANIATQFNIQLTEHDCSVTSSDVRVYITQKDAYRYPDVTVFCGEPAYLSGRTDTITNPVVLVEVLSPATALQDHNDKLEEYVQIETLQAYLLVSQARAKVQRFMRQSGADWAYTIASELEDTVTVPVIGCTLALADVYRKVTLDPQG